MIECRMLRKKTTDQKMKKFEKNLKKELDKRK